ncbi:MAG: ketol-acid reductoisomerase [Acidibacillus sp.]|nr:ketol-acid reductoisomerase [Acidibacillus sp.]
MRQIFYEKDASLDILNGKSIGILGYGKQGRSQALNMRDSGISNIIIGNIKDESFNQAEQDGFPVMKVRAACQQADIIFMLIPDEEQPKIYEEEVFPELKPGKVLNFASGYNITYGHIKPIAGIDVTMVAPRMIGAAVRSLYISGKGYPAFLDVAQDASGTAWNTTLAIALAIGALKSGSMAVSFAEESWMDLLTEQATLPLIYKVMEAAFNVQVKAGLPPEAVLLEMYMSKEPAEIFNQAATIGLFEQIKLHSQTSQFGQISILPKIETGQFEEFIKNILENRIKTGEFAEEWKHEQKQGLSNFLKMRNELLLHHKMSLAEKQLQVALGKEYLEEE